MERATALARLFPFLNWGRRLRGEVVKADLVAGLIGAIIVLPQGVALATIAGMPPAYGIYASIVPAIVAALFGSSWHLASGPTTAISILIFSALAPFATPGSPDYIQLVLTLTFLTGFIQLALGLARLGILVNFISHTVVIGMTTAAAFLIFASQVRHFFGIDIPRGTPFHETFILLFQQLGAINPYITTVGAVTLLTGALVKKYVPKIPYMIAAVLVGSLLAVGLNSLYGASVTGIKTIGALPQQLPPLSSPGFSLDALQQVFFSAIVVALLGLTEAVAIARAIAIKSGQRIDGNQEFVGQGLSNIAGSFFSAFAASGSFNRSGLNYEAGAKTPLASVFAAVFLVAILLLAGQIAAYMPIAAIAGILFLVGWGLIDVSHIRHILTTSRAEATILIITFVGSLVDLERGIFLGMVASLIFFLYKTSRPQIQPVIPHSDDSFHFVEGDGTVAGCPRLKIIRIDGSIYYGSTDYVQGELQRIDAENPEHKHVLIVARGISFIDLAGAHMLAAEAKRRRMIGGGLYFYRLNDAGIDVLRKGHYLEEIGEENLYGTQPNVTDRIKKRIGCQTAALPGN